jgi:hypothetical protein
MAPSLHRAAAALRSGKPSIIDDRVTGRKHGCPAGAMSLPQAIRQPSYRTKGRWFGPQFSSSAQHARTRSCAVFSGTSSKCECPPNTSSETK